MKKTYLINLIIIIILLFIPTSIESQTTPDIIQNIGEKSWWLYQQDRVITNETIDKYELYQLRNGTMINTTKTIVDVDEIFSGLKISYFRDVKKGIPVGEIRRFIHPEINNSNSSSIITFDYFERTVKNNFSIFATLDFLGYVNNTVDNYISKSVANYVFPLDVSIFDPINYTINNQKVLAYKYRITSNISKTAGMLKQTFQTFNRTTLLYGNASWNIINSYNNGTLQSINGSFGFNTIQQYDGYYSLEVLNIVEENFSVFSDSDSDTIKMNSMTSKTIQTDQSISLFSTKKLIDYYIDGPKEEIQETETETTSITSISITSTILSITPISSITNKTSLFLGSVLIALIVKNKKIRK